MDHYCRRPGLADTIKVITSQGRRYEGNLSVMSPRDNHQYEETLTIEPLDQFQRSDNTTTNSIAHFHTDTPSQSEIFSDHNNNSTINKNIVTSRTNTSFQREIFSETGTDTCSSDNVETEFNQAEASNSSSYFMITTSSKLKYFLVTITDLISVTAQPPKVK